MKEKGDNKSIKSSLSKMKKSNLKKGPLKSETLSNMQFTSKGGKNGTLNKSSSMESYSIKEIISNIFPGDSFIPKNINEYKHLIDETRLVKSDIDWTLGLRSKEPPMKRYIPFDISSSSPPSFYDEDAIKYKQKARKPNNNPFYKTDNGFKLYHLIQDKARKGFNFDMLMFETTLRNFKLKDGSKSVHHLQKWHNLPYDPKGSFHKFLPPLSQNNKDNLMKINKYVTRPYACTYKKIKYNEEDILVRSVRPDMNSTMDFLGHHNLMANYSANYQIKNLGLIRHILGTHSNSVSLFESSLRSYYKSSDNFFQQSQNNKGSSNRFNLKKNIKKKS